jgi:hypothetical protein
MTQAMIFRGGRVMRRRLAGTGIAAALAGLMLTVAGCSQVLPLGPAPSQLASPIALQPVLGQAALPSGRCPAGSVTLTGPATVIPGTPSGQCYRRLGQPATFTTAAVTVRQQPPGPQRQPAGYAVFVTLLPADTATLTAITAKVAGTKELMGIIVGGQAWAALATSVPITGGQFSIPAPSKAMALQFQHILQASS